jgi:hypothetical protein
VNLSENNVPKMGSNLGRRLGVIYFRFTPFGNTYVLMDKSKQLQKNLSAFEYTSIYIYIIMIYIYIHIIIFSVSFATPHKLFTSIFHKLPNIRGGRNSSVGIATGYRLDGPGIESRWGRDFSHTSKPGLGSTHVSVQWVPGLSLG